MFICPNCRNRLSRTQNKIGFYWVCPNCGGRAVSVPLLRRVLARDYVNSLWAAARDGEGTPGRRCPACDRRMLEVAVLTAGESIKLDVCKSCEFVWFDPSEFESAPACAPEPGKQDVADRSALPQAAREKLAIYEARLLAEQKGDELPDAGWKTIPAIFGMPVEVETKPLQHVPWLTWSVAALVALVSLFAFTNLRTAIQDFGLIPAQAWRDGGATFLTSFFLHGGFWHLFSNLYFLIVFGMRVEDFIGWEKLLVLLVFAALAGDVLHILGDPHSDAPCIGASGGISGIIAYYSLKLPHARLGFLFRSIWLSGYVRWVQVPAWGAFALWIMIQLLGSLQQLSGFGRVSALAHLGGAAAGFLFWLVWRKVELQPGD